MKNTWKVTVMHNSPQESWQWEQQRSISCRAGVAQKGFKGILQLSRMASSGKVGAKTTFIFILTFLQGCSRGQFKGNCANTLVCKPQVSSVSQPVSCSRGSPLSTSYPHYHGRWGSLCWREGWDLSAVGVAAAWCNWDHVVSANRPSFSGVSSVALI